MSCDVTSGDPHGRQKCTPVNEENRTVRILSAVASKQYGKFYFYKEAVQYYSPVSNWGKKNDCCSCSGCRDIERYTDAVKMSAQEGGSGFTL